MSYTPLDSVNEMGMIEAVLHFPFFSRMFIIAFILVFSGACIYSAIMIIVKGWNKEKRSKSKESLQTLLTAFSISLIVLAIFLPSASGNQKKLLSHDLAMSNVSLKYNIDNLEGFHDVEAEGKLIYSGIYYGENMSTEMIVRFDDQGEPFILETGQVTSDLIKQLSH